MNAIEPMMINLYFKLLFLYIFRVGSPFFKFLYKRLQNATSRINTAFFVTEKQITPHRIWYDSRFL